MTKQKLFIANWKMNMPLHDLLSFVRCNRNELQELANNPDNKVILCPSFPLLALLNAEINDINISLGAQNCSEYEQGAYTGQVSAQILADVKCNYCIVGHSECRIAFNETSEQIAAKVLQLLKKQITPVICIGESLEQKQAGITKEVLSKQIAPLIISLKDYTGMICLAYEPIWAIGTGRTPIFSELQETCTFLADYLKKELPMTNVALIYGGSIDESNAREILSLDTIKGLLIGGASLNFKKFQKIVSLVK